MPVEIEKKFLVSQISHIPHLSETGAVKIEQGYLVVGPHVEQRIRRKGDTYFMTVKGSGDLSRQEWETEIPKDVYELLRPMIVGNLIQKTRYIVPYLLHKLEVDVFAAELSGLVLIESEFLSEAEAESFFLPDWLLGSLEVTYDSRFKNRNLALNPKTVLELLSCLS